MQYSRRYLLAHRHATTPTLQRSSSGRGALEPRGAPPRRSARHRLVSTPSVSSTPRPARGTPHLLAQLRRVLVPMHRHDVLGGSAENPPPVADDRERTIEIARPTTAIVHHPWHRHACDRARRPQTPRTTEAGPTPQTLPLPCSSQLRVSRGRSERREAGHPVVANAIVRSAMWGSAKQSSAGPSV